MAYTIIKSDGTILTTIADGTINTTSTSLGLPGRNFAGYGQSLDTNFVHQVENFADSTPPPNPLRGQLWYNTTNSTMYICPADGQTNAAEWIAITTTTSGGTTTFANVIVTGTLQSNNITANGSLQASEAAFTNITVAGIANINTNNSNTANINVLTTANITTGAPTTPGSMTGTWTITGGAAGNTLIVNDGNLVVSSGIIANSFTFPNGTPIVPEGYNNANVNEYLQGIGNISAANRFQGNIYPSTVYVDNGTVSAPSYTANSDTGTGIYFPAANSMAFTLGGNETVRLNATGTALEVTGNANVAGNLEITGNANIDSAILGTANITGNATVGSSLSVTGNANIGPSFSVAANTISLQPTTAPVSPADGTIWNTTTGLYGQFSGNSRYIGGQLISFTANTTTPTLTNNQKYGGNSSIPGWVANLSFNTVSYDIGNVFNSTTGIFTVPVTGLYLLTASSICDSVGTASPGDGLIATLRSFKNGVLWTAGINTQTMLWGINPVSNVGPTTTISSSIVQLLNENDQIDLQIQNAGLQSFQAEIQFGATLISPT